jgi:DNA modification methylase
MAKSSPKPTVERPRLEWVPPGSAKPNPSQWVTHPEAQLNGLRALIFGDQSPGWAGAVVINERLPEKGWADEECGHYYVDGHARDALAQETGEDVPAVIGQWTPAEEKQLLALINPLGAMAIAVPDKQLALLEETISLTDDPTITAALRNLAEAAETAVSLLNTAEALEGLDSDDDGPQIDLTKGAEYRAKWGTETGQLWTIPSATLDGRAHRLMCSDSLSADDVARLLDGAKLRFLSTDPPYGVQYDSTWRVETGLSGGEYAAGTINNDDIVDWSPVYEQWGRPDILYIWHGGLHADKVKLGLEGLNYQIRSQIIWVKPSPVISRGHYHWQHEPCWYAVRKSKTANWQGDRTQTTVWFWGNGSATARSEDEVDAFHAGHISQKPVELFRRPLRNHTIWGEVVGEPFAGSGSQYVAGEQLGRLVYGMDNDPEAVAMTLERLSLMGLEPKQMT